MSSPSSDDDVSLTPIRKRTSSIHAQESLLHLRSVKEAAVTRRRYWRSRSEALRYDVSSDEGTTSEDWDIPPVLPCNDRGRELHLETSGLSSYFHQAFSCARSRYQNPSLQSLLPSYSVDLPPSPIVSFKPSLPSVEALLPGADLPFLSSYTLALGVITLDLLVSQIARILIEYRSQQQFHEFFESPHRSSNQQVPDIDIYLPPPASYHVWPHGLDLASFQSQFRSSLTAVLRSQFKPLLASSVPLLTALSLHPTSRQLRTAALLWVSLFCSAGSLRSLQSLLREMAFTLTVAEKANVSSEEQLIDPRKAARRESAPSLVGAFYSSMRSSYLESFVSNESLSLIAMAEIIMQRPLSLRGRSHVLFIYALQ